MENKNILILIEAMAPFTHYWGGCQRAYHYGQKFISDGYNVHVICRNQSELNEGVVNNNGLIVSGRGKARLFNSLDINTEQNKYNIKQRIKNIIKNNRHFTSLARELFRFIYSEPSAFDGAMSSKWVRENISYIEDYIDKNRISTVIISGPPFGLFYIVKKIKKHNVTVILDYRDPWYFWYERISIASIYERIAIKSADLVITATDGLAEAIKTKYNVNNVYPILNGYDINLWNNLSGRKKTEDGFTISHIGLLSLNKEGAFRNPSVFLTAVDEFVKSHQDAKVQFVGVSNPEEGYAMGLDQKISFLPPVSIERSLEMIIDSSLLVALHTANDSSGKYIICGKIYDYLKSGNLILSIGDTAFANKNIVEKMHAGIHSKNDKREIIDALEKLYTAWKEEDIRDGYPNVEMYSREYQNTEFLRLIKNL